MYAKSKMLEVNSSNTEVPQLGNSLRLDQGTLHVGSTMTVNGWCIAQCNPYFMQDESPHAGFMLFMSTPPRMLPISGAALPDPCREDEKEERCS